MICQRLLQSGVLVQGTFVQERVYSVPCGRIHDLAMPDQCSDLVASCSHEEIRLWDTRRHSELLRIEVSNLDCLCLTIPKVLLAALNNPDCLTAHTECTTQCPLYMFCECKVHDTCG